MAMIEELHELETQAARALASSKNPAELAEWKSAYLGKQGAFTRLGKGLGGLPADERPLAGQKFNQVRQQLEQALALLRKVRVEHGFSVDAQAGQVLGPQRAVELQRRITGQCKVAHAHDVAEGVQRGQVRAL